MGKLLMKFVGVTLTLNPAELVFLYLLWIMRRVSESNGYRNRPFINDRITAYAIKNNRISFLQFSILPVETIVRIE